MGEKLGNGSGMLAGGLGNGSGMLLEVLDEGRLALDL